MFFYFVCPKVFHSPKASIWSFVFSAFLSIFLFLLSSFRSSSLSLYMCVRGCACGCLSVCLTGWRLYTFLRSSDLLLCCRRSVITCFNFPACVCTCQLHWDKKPSAAQFALFELFTGTVYTHSFIIHATSLHETSLWGCLCLGMSHHVTNAVFKGSIRKTPWQLLCDILLDKIFILRWFGDMGKFFAYLLVWGERSKEKSKWKWRHP